MTRKGQEGKSVPGTATGKVLREDDLGLFEEQGNLFHRSTSEGEEEKVGWENVADERRPPSL